MAQNDPSQRDGGANSGENTGGSGPQLQNACRAAMESHVRKATAQERQGSLKREMR